MGGASPKLYLPFALISMVLALLVAFGTRRQRLGATVVLLGLGAFSAVQALSLPLSALAALSPAAADVWARVLLPVGRQVSHGSISLDPGASLVEASKWFSYAATFFVAAHVGRTRGASHGLALVFAGALLVALVTLGHALFGATSVYGLYAPQNTFEQGALGPFLNPNNLAGYLNLGALIGLGLALAKVPIVSRWALGCGVLFLGVMSVRTGSRGGLGALLLFGVFLALWAAGTRALRSSRRAIGGALGVLTASVGVLSLLGLTDRFSRELLSTNMDKLQMTRWSLPVIRDFRWFGVGRGAFESVFFAYRPSVEGHVVFTHPENFLVQWVTEWGAPVALAGMLGLAWSLRALRRGIGKSSVVLGACCACGALFLQNLVDLGLELGAVGAAAAATLGAAWGSIKTPSNEVSTMRSKWAGWLVPSGFFASAVLTTVVLAMRPSTVAEDRAALRRMIDSGSDAAAILVEVERQTLRHPADYYFPLAGAFAVRADGNPMPWIQRALERGPTVGRTYVLLGEILLERGRVAQGFDELRRGVGFEPRLAILAGTIGIRYSQDASMLVRVAPEGEVGAMVLNAMAGRVKGEERADLRERLDSEALARAPLMLEPRARLVERYLVALSAKSSPCIERERCERIVQEHAEFMLTQLPAHTMGVRVKARLLVLQGHPREATDFLLEGCNRPGERVTCLLLRAQILASEGPSAELESAVDAYVAASCTERLACAQAHNWVGLTRLSQGQSQQAVTAFEKAARSEPTVARWLAAADAAEQAGLKAAEISALEEAIALGGSDQAALKARLATLKTRER